VGRLTSGRTRDHRRSSSSSHEPTEIDCDGLTLPILFRCVPNGHTVRVTPSERERPYLPICEICGEPVARVPDVMHGRRRYHPGACKQAACRARNPRKPGAVRLAWVEAGS